MWVPFLDQEEPMENEMATHLVFLPGNHKDRGAWQATVHRVAEELGTIEPLNNIVKYMIIYFIYIYHIATSNGYPML